VERGWGRGEEKYALSGMRDGYLDFNHFTVIGSIPFSHCELWLEVLINSKKIILICIMRDQYLETVA
jgi:hypothetical protein